MKEELDRINALSLWDFETVHNENDGLLILGSNDFTYYHYLEAEFTGVTFCDLPVTFSHAQFRLGRDIGDDISTIWVTAESMVTTLSTEFEIRATGLQVRIGKVYYYDRENLQPGERIASARARNPRS
jgi:hypothetical protein